MFGYIFPCFLITGMKNAMKIILQILSINCIHQRARAFLTAESMCWDIFSRYRTHHTTSIYSGKIQLSLAACLYSACVFLVQGGAPSPFDRNFGTKLGVRAIQWISERLTENFRQGRVWGFNNIAYIKLPQTMGKLWLRLHFPARPRIRQLTRYSLCARPQQESHLIHPCHWIESCDWFWVSKFRGFVK